MATNKKPRKAYKPKRKVGNLLGYMAKLEPAVVDEDLISYRMSLDALIKGYGTIRDSDMITGALNACAILCLKHDGLREHYPVAVAGQDAQREMTDRVKMYNKRILYTGPEMEAVKVALDLYEQQVPLMTPRDMVNAATLVTQTLVKRK
jgi:hypothetical protein